MSKPSWIVVVALLLSAVALAQEDDLGDTGAPPPTPEDLGVVKEEPPPAEPKPKPKPKPKAPPGPPPPPAPPAAPAAEVVEKAKKLKADLDAALIAEPGDQKALDALASGWQPDSVLSIEPALRPLLKLARARSLTMQNRLDEATTALNEARGLVDAAQGAEHKKLVGHFRYRLGELEEAKSKLPAKCGASLGLRRLRAAEGSAARARMQRLTAKYKNAVQPGERFWSRRAAFKIASLYADFYAASLAERPSFRGVSLPSPFAISRFDEGEVTQEILGGPWPAEISRLFSEVLASIDAREPDPILLELVRKEAAAFARVSLPGGDKIENPWRRDERAGLIRYNRRFEKRNDDGSWTPVDPALARKDLALFAEKAPGSVEHAYALAGLAEAGPAPSTAAILAALDHADARVKLAGLVAAEKQPDAALYDAVVAAFASADDKGPLFNDLKSALFGMRERALLALRAIANKDRTIAEKVMQEQKLPPRERVWVIAELGESRLNYTLQNLVWDKDPNVAATALYALFLSAGKNSLGYMRPNEPGVLGCVSKGLQALD